MGRIALSDAQRFLESLGVAERPPRTTPFDPGYDPATLESHLEQSARLMQALKLSMASWMIAAPASTQRKIDAVASFGVPTIAGGGPFEIATDQGALEAYLDLCATMGFHMIECAEGFTALDLDPARVARLVRERGLDVQFELGGKHSGPIGTETAAAEIAKGRAWLDAGAEQLVVEAREDARGSGVFDEAGRLHGDVADALASAFGLDRLVFEAPTKPSQFALMNHFGDEVRLGNVRLEEVLRVEVYRRGLHPDSYRPRRP